MFGQTDGEEGKKEESLNYRQIRRRTDAATKVTSAPAGERRRETSERRKFLGTGTVYMLAREGRSKDERGGANMRGEEQG